LRATLVESSHGDAGFEARFAGEARFLPDDADGTEVTCEAAMHVELELPALFAWMPVAPLEALGNSLIQAAMQGLSGRLVPLMQRDIRRWVAAKKV
jgi:hypothetical protein